MPDLILTPPHTTAEPVSEFLHRTTVTDPYRWLEDQNSPRTRAWIDDQTCYARSYLDNLPGREPIRKRVREFLAVDTSDSLRKAGNRYFFRKRQREQEQPSLYMREGPEGSDQLLLDPMELGRGAHIALKLLRVSSDGRLLLYEIKEGGERSGSFVLFDVDNRKTLADRLPKGYMRGFAFSPDRKAFYYVRQPHDGQASGSESVYLHILGEDFCQDRRIFTAREPRARIAMISDEKRIGLLVYRADSVARRDFYVKSFDSASVPELVVGGATFAFSPAFADGRIFARTNRNSPNFRIVELLRLEDRSYEWLEIVPETEARIREWLVAGDRILAVYESDGRTEIATFDFAGRAAGRFGSLPGETVRLAGASSDGNEVFIDSESFRRPLSIDRYSPKGGALRPWFHLATPFDSTDCVHERISFRSKDGTSIPMFLFGREDRLQAAPVLLTSYGGFGKSIRPQFSVLAALLVERGCVLALPSIRGGSDFGAAWHEAARRQNRQTACDDFLSAAEWLIETRRTSRDKLAIFGGSNSGLLVLAAMTQRPELFCCVLCMVPLADMLRYHLFDGADAWQDEFGTSADPADFEVLLQYSPYHRVRDGADYPATLIVSGDADQNCNPLHARKMTARLQAANSSNHPILLDYSRFRGHSPVLPLSDRIEALTDRVGFLVDQLGLSD